MPGAFVCPPSPVFRFAPCAPSVPNAGSAPIGQVYPWSLRGEPDDADASDKHGVLVDLDARAGAACHRYAYPSVPFFQSYQAYPWS